MSVRLLSSGESRLVEVPDEMRPETRLILVPDGGRAMLERPELASATRSGGVETSLRVRVSEKTSTDTETKGKKLFFTNRASFPRESIKLIILN